MFSDVLRTVNQHSTVTVQTGARTGSCACIITGNHRHLPTVVHCHCSLCAGFLFYKGVSAANKAAEDQDRMDGYIK